VLVRFGYVAMSTVVEKASPSQTMTATAFAKLEDRDAAIRKLERIAEQNLANTLRLLKHNLGHDIRFYRFSSRLIPLIGHEMLAGWDPFSRLAEPFAAIGAFVREHGMRVGFHPDHFTVLSTPRADVLANSVADLDRHVRMLECMGLDERAKLNVHIGGAYGDKKRTMERFLRQFAALPERIRNRMMLENDDKTFTAAETLKACETLGVPMVLDIHHHAVNHGGESVAQLWPRILATWAGQAVPPKIHASSPRSEQDPRSHADYVRVSDLAAFFREVAEMTPELDVMIEAKMKDGALFKLMVDLEGVEGAERTGGASIRFTVK
jgi:UV DNA damage endonuclease